MEQDLRTLPEVLATFERCIERGMKVPEMVPEIQKVYPHERLSAPQVQQWLNKRAVWEGFIVQFGRTRTERLWNLRQSYLRHAAKGRHKEQSLSDLLEPEKPQSQLTGNSPTHKRKVGHA